jgi:hypothetical protein
MRWSRFAVLLLIGCADPTSPQDDLYVAASVSSTSIRAGEPLTITVVVKNTGKRGHVVSELSACSPPFEVTTTAGTVVAPAYPLCLLVGVSRKLAPGEVYSRTLNWHGEGVSGKAWPSPDVRFLAAGEYQLRPRILSEAGRITGKPIPIRIE